MPITHADLTTVLTAAFPDASIELVDLAGDDDHWELRIGSPIFEGKSRIEQHRLVQSAVKSYNIHALSIKIIPYPGG